MGATGSRASIYLLIGVLVVMWGATSAGLVWWHWSDRQRSATANDYYLASADWAGLIEKRAVEVEALLHVSSHLLGRLNGDGADAGHAELDGDANRLTHVKQLDDHLYQTGKILVLLEAREARFGTGETEATLGLLTAAVQQLSLAIKPAHESDVHQGELIVTLAKNFRLRSEQLRRLHGVLYNRQIELSARERARDQWILIGLFAAALLLALALVRVILSQISQSEARQQESDRLLRSAARIANLAYAVWDEVEDRYSTITDGYATLLGCDPATFRSQYGQFKDDVQLIHPDDRERYRSLSAKSREANAPLEIEYRIVTPANENRHILEISEPIFDGSGAMTRSLVTILDITRHKETEELFLQAQKMDAIGQLTGGLAHDFNNLLAIIMGNIELAKEPLAEDDFSYTLLGTALRAVDRGASLTHQLLAFARKQPLFPTMVDLRERIVEMDDLLRRTLGETIEIEMVGNRQTWSCEIDLHQFEMALINLAINARDAMPDGGKLTIEIANMRIDDDYAAALAEVTPGQYVMVSVSDTGTGMSKEIRENIFQPFFTTKEVGRGTGLGLSMVFGFVKQSKGHISVYSEVGEGTTFKVFFPRFYGKDHTLAETPAQEADLMSRGETILVVEDDIDVRTLVVTLLSSLDYRLLEVGNAQSGIDALRSEPGINLLLTDLVLPGGINGRQLADEAQSLSPGLPVLYMSGYTEDAIIHQGRLDPGVHLLQKPFRKSDLAKAGRAAIG